MNNKTVKNTVLTLLFYGLYFLLSYIAEYFVKSGPCTPGLGILLLIFLPFLSLFLCIASLIRYFSYQKKYVRFSLIIHSVMLVLFFVYFLAISTTY
jgi:hypothetical protein